MSRALVHACAGVALGLLASCSDGIRLNSDNDVWKALPGTPTAFELESSELGPLQLVWRRDPKAPSEPILGPAPAGGAYEYGTVAWDDRFVVGTRHRYDAPRRGPADARIAWFIVDLRDTAGPRVAYDGEDRAAYAAARAKDGVPASLLPKPLLHYWPNWDCSPRPWGREDRAPHLDPQSGAGSTVRALPVGQGFFVQDELRTFLCLARDPSDPGVSITPKAFTRRTSDVFRIAWDDRFIVADACFLVSDGRREPTVDRTTPIAGVVVDTKTGRESGVLNRRSIGEIRREFGVPDALQPRDVLDVWPDWPGIRRPWRNDPETRKFLGLD